MAVVNVFTIAAPATGNELTIYATELYRLMGRAGLSTNPTSWINMTITGSTGGTSYYSNMYFFQMNTEGLSYSSSSGYAAYGVVYQLVDPTLSTFEMSTFSTSRALTIPAGGSLAIYYIA